MSKATWLTAAALLAVAVFVRFERLDVPNSVVFDEVHFGGMASLYLNRTYFFDVHPPLGKLLFAAVAQRSGYKGNFNFKSIGVTFPDHVPYVAMRQFSAACGALVVPLMYLTARAFGMSQQSSCLIGLLVLFESALATQSRFIMLDASMVLFIVAAAWGWAQFRAVRSKPFSLWWWLTLLLTGVFLSCAVSVKLVGAFVVVMVGLATVRDLWELLCDPTVTMPKFAKHFLARALCLIAVPIAIYLALFWVHFEILYKPGPGAKMVSARFRANLEQNVNRTSGIPRDVAYGAEVVIRQDAAVDHFLHSHKDVFPDSKRQQVTIYGHADENNLWEIVDATDNDAAILGATPTVRYVHDRQLMRLRHKTTGKFLAVVATRHAPASSGYIEVSAVSPEEIAGADVTVWRIEFQPPRGNNNSAAPSETTRLHALSTNFHLVHVSSGCILQSTDGVELPKWGFNQQEVSCLPARLAYAVDHDAIFYVGNQSHPLVDRKTVEQAAYRRMTYWQKMQQLHRMMVHANDMLGDNHPFHSAPWEWPLFRKGVPYWSSSNNAQVYFVGNYVVTWFALLAIPLYIVMAILARLAIDRQMIESTEAFDAVRNAGWYFFGGWFLHWATFFMFKRQLFLHHYLPALVFSIGLVGVFFECLTVAIPDLLTRIWRRRMPDNKPEQPPKLSEMWPEELLRWLMVAAIVGITAWAYWQHTPLMVGTPMSKEVCQALAWVETWQVQCR